MSALVLPTLEQLAAIKRCCNTTVRHLLADEDVYTNKDLAAYLKRNILPGKSECNYDILVRKFGEVNADRIMRLVEVAEWSSDPMFAAKG